MGYGNIRTLVLLAWLYYIITDMFLATSAKYLQGWTDQNEGARTITGHDAVEEQPRPQAAPAAPAVADPATVEAEPGGNR